jgi:hypothetical protein
MLPHADSQAGAGAPRRHVKIFGERNTATNALKKLVERNSGSRVLPSVASELERRGPRRVRMISKLPFGPALREIYIDRVFRSRAPRLSWKHCATTFSDVSEFRDCLVLLTTRHPASWLLALHRRPYHHREAVPERFEEFLTTEWRPTKRDNLKLRSLTPIEMWNVKSRSHVAFASALSSAGIAWRWVAFERFVCDQASVFEDLRSVLVEPAAAVSPVTESTKDRTKDYLYYRDYYGQCRWLTEIDPVSRQLIDGAVDWDIASGFGYRPLAAMAREFGPAEGDPIAPALPDR